MHEIKRRHFIAALGKNDYSRSYYADPDTGIPGEKTQFVQEAILDHLNFNKTDKITILLTKEARQSNWTTSRIRDEGPGEGLYTILKRKYDCEIVSVDIETGKNNEELWRNFESIYNAIDENDIVYFDITNALRSLSMMIFTVLNYAGVLKKARIGKIYYGAFETPITKEDGKQVTPILDVTSFGEIQSWTAAADSFLKYGHGEPIRELTRQKNTEEGMKELSDIAAFTNAIETSMGSPVLEGSNTDNKKISIYGAAHNFVHHRFPTSSEDGVWKMINPLYEKMKDSVIPFDNPDPVTIGLETLDWTIRHQMIQQGYTALLETIITFVACCNGLDYHDYAQRDQIRKYIYNPYYNDLSGCYSVKDTKEKAFLQSKYQNSLSDSLLQKLKKLLIKCRTNRNLINHYGYGKTPVSYQDLKRDLQNNTLQLKRSVENYRHPELPFQ